MGSPITLTLGDDSSQTKPELGTDRRPPIGDRPTKRIRPKVGLGSSDQLVERGDPTGN